MEMITLLLFIPACFALNMSPGPNNLLAMSNAKNYGFRRAVIAGTGRLLAFCGMIFLASTGLAAILFASERIFIAIKIAGASYLFWLAFKLWISTPHKTKENRLEVPRNLFSLTHQEFLLAAGNPKAILIFTAFLPQFINHDTQTDLQFLQLGSIFLLLEWLAITLYALFGIYLRQWFSQPHKRQLFNRGCATLLGCAGAGLLASRQHL